MSIQQFILILRAHWRISALVLFLLVSLTIGISLLQTKQYVASATVLADIKADPVAGSLVTTTMPANYIATQVDVVSSDRVARHVVELLRLNEEPRNRQQWLQETGGNGDLTVWLAEMLRRHLEVTPSRESNVINIAVEWVDPKQAAVIANAFAQAYIDINVQLKVAPARQYTDWFKERSEALRDDLATKQQKLADFQREKGIIATDERLDIEAARLNQLSTQLVDIQAVRADSESRQMPHGNVDALPEVLQSPLVAGLKTELSNAEIRLDGLRDRLGSAHPDYVRAEGEVEDLRARVAQETAKIVRSMRTNAEVNTQRENAVRAALDEQKARVLEMKRQRDEAAVLESDVQTAQRDLDAVNQRLAQSSLESLSQQTTVALLTPATAPFRHSSPKVRTNAVIALFLGTILGALIALWQEFRDPRVRSQDDLLKILDVPFLGSIRGATAEIINASPAASLPARARYLPVQME